ncbi:hypothetical protein ACFFWB_26660 [Flavobacterium procerum]
MIHFLSDKLSESEIPVIIVAHAGVIRSILCHLHRLP